MRAVRTINIVDAFTCERLALEGDVSLPGERLTRASGSAPGVGVKSVSWVDNGPEVQSKALDTQAHRAGEHLQFSRPGTLVDNTVIDAVGSCFRNECRTIWFRSVADTRRTIAARRERYNVADPHRALDGHHVPEARPPRANL